MRSSSAPVGPGAADATMAVIFRRPSEGGDVESIRRAMETASTYLAEHPENAAEADVAATAVRREGLRFRVEGRKEISSPTCPRRWGRRHSFHARLAVAGSTRVV